MRKQLEKGKHLRNQHWMDSGQGLTKKSKHKIFP